MTTSEDYRTSDMALTTFLKVSGHSPQRIVWEHGTCYWYFSSTQTLLAAVDTFLSGAARIEPREYNQMFTRTKREFYDSKQELDHTG